MNGDALAPDQALLVEAIARRVVELLDASDDHPSLRRLVNAAELAKELSVARSFVYEHADELGAVRLGGGSKPRLRFDLERARAAVSCSAGGRSQAGIASADAGSEQPSARGRRRLPSRVPKPGSVLAIRGEGSA